MPQKERSEDLLLKLATGKIIVLSPSQWEEVASDFPVKDAIGTGLAGDILLVRRSLPGKKKIAWAIVEEPKPSERVIRPLATEKEARALIADRMAAYERMWDG